MVQIQQTLKIALKINFKSYSKTILEKNEINRNIG